MRYAAIPLLIAFIGLLGFIYLMVQTRRKIRKEELKRLREESLHNEQLLHNIRGLCIESRDIDLSAELILMMIRDYEIKEIK